MPENTIYDLDSDYLAKFIKTGGGTAYSGSPAFTATEAVGVLNGMGALSFASAQSLTVQQQHQAMTNLGLNDVDKLFAQTADVTIANTTTETSFFGTGVGSLTIPANTLVAGNVMRFYLKGMVSTTSNPTSVFRVKIGSVTAATSSSSPGANLSNAIFEIEALITCRSAGATGSIVIDEMSYIAGSNSGNITGRAARSGVQTIDTTVDNTIDVTYQWGTAAAGNTITCEQAIVEFMTN